MSVPYDYYRVFYYVAAYRSISRAAAVLSCSQPGVSRTISNLETELGTKLFTRSSSGVTLTEAGRELISHVEPAIRHLKAAEEGIRNARELRGGILTIGISTCLTRGVMEDYLTSAIDGFRSEFPDVRLEMTHDSTPRLMHDVSNELIDVAIVSMDHSVYGDYRPRDCNHLFSYDDIVIAGTDYAAISKRKKSIKELKDYPMIGLGETTDTYNYYKFIFSGYGLEYKLSVKTISTGQTLVYCMENFGIGFIYPKDAKRDLDEGKLVQIRLKEKLPKRNISVIREGNKESAKVFEKMLFESIDP